MTKYSNYMDDYIKKIGWKSTKTADIIKMKANSQVNKLESVPLQLTNASESLQAFLYQNKFPDLRQQLGRLISVEGRAALAIIPTNDGNAMIDAMSVQAFDQSFAQPKWVVLSGAVNVIINGSPYPLYTEYSWEGDLVKIERYTTESIMGKTEKTPLENSDPIYLSGQDRLPVHIFKNNPMMESDIDIAGIQSELRQLEEIDKVAISTFHMTNAKMYYNKNFTGGLDINKETKKIQTGEQAYIAERSDAAAIQGGAAILPSVPGYDLILSYTAELENKIYKVLGIDRDTTATGTNSLILETINQNAKGFENLQREYLRRQEDYEMFLTMLSRFLNQPIPEVVLKLSTLEQLRLDSLTAAIADIQMANDNKQAQKEGNDDE